METRVFAPEMIVSVLPALLRFLDITLIVGCASIFFGSVGGALLAWCKLSGGRAVALIAEGYIYAMRCTPSIVLLFLVFYGLPQIAERLFSVDFNDADRMIFAVITFSLLFAAYIAEVFRASYLALPQGQMEAAAAIGLSPFAGFRHVALPQTALIALPNFANAAINLMKEGALAYTIGLVDLLGKGNLIIAQNFGAYGTEVYLACMLIYWGLTFAMTQIFRYWERRLDKGQSLARAQGGFRLRWRKGGAEYGA